jgi:ABC-type branched-subunit amino acid transport system substrate-binding protein
MKIIHKIIIAVVLAVIVIAGSLYYYFSSLPTAAPKKAPIKIAAVFSLTGANARHGTSTCDGVRYYVEKINFEGGIRGHLIDLVVYDDKSDPSVGASMVEKAISVDNVVAVIGGYGTAIAVPEAEVAERLKCPYFAAGSIDIKLFQRGYKWIFRAIPDSYGYAKPMFEFLQRLQKEDPGLKKMWITATTTSSAALEQEKFIINALNATFQIMVENFPTGTADVRPMVIKMREFNPDVVVFIQYYTETVLLLKSMMELGVRPKLVLGSWGMGEAELIKELGGKAEYLFGGAGWTPTAAYPGTQEFFEDFKRKFGYAPDYHQLYGGASLLAVKAAIENLIDAGKELTRENLRDALEKIDIWTPLGRVKFSLKPEEHPLGEVHQNIYAEYIIFQVLNGTQVAVWPPEAAAVKYVYPPPLRW